MMETDRQLALASMIARSASNDADSLLNHVSPDEREQVLNLMKDSSVMQIKKLLLKREFADLQNIHPEWILHFLKDESVRVIGIILRYLPSRQVRYIIQNLPKDKRENLPHMIESFAVSPQILELIRQKFLNKFIFASNGKDKIVHIFESLSGQEMDAILRELGIIELALSLSDISKSYLKIIYNRLKFSDAKKLKARLVEFGSEPDQIRRQARLELLSLNLKEEGENNLVHEMGINFLSQLISDLKQNQMDVIVQRLSLKEGYKLSRLSKEFSNLKSEKTLERRLVIFNSVMSELRKRSAISGLEEEETNTVAGSV